jgi:ABC-type phosphate transport system ATPase subunit
MANASVNDNPGAAEVTDRKETAAKHCGGRIPKLVAAFASAVSSSIIIMNEGCERLPNTASDWAMIWLLPSIHESINDARTTTI